MHGMRRRYVQTGWDRSQFWPVYPLFVGSMHFSISTARKGELEARFSETAVPSFHNRGLDWTYHNASAIAHTE